MKNGVYQVRLVVLRYHQIPEINHGDNFKLVMNKVIIDHEGKFKSRDCGY